jgi:hypothetical protein
MKLQLLHTFSLIWIWKYTLIKDYTILLSTFKLHRRPEWNFTARSLLVPDINLMYLYSVTIPQTELTFQRLSVSVCANVQAFSIHHARRQGIWHPSWYTIWQTSALVYEILRWCWLWELKHLSSCLETACEASCPLDNSQGWCRWWHGYSIHEWLVTRYTTESELIKEGTKECVCFI